MGYTKMNRHNYPDIEGLTEAERAKLDHIDDIEDDLADAYDSTATYAVGDWCIRNGKLYECITAIATAEPFDSTKWRRVAVAELKSNLTDLTTYSTTEKIVGYWTDGTTPIYEKSFEFTNELVLQQNTWVSIGESASTYSKILGCWGTSALGVFWGFLACACDSTYVNIQSLRSSQIGVKYLTLRYIKS